MQRQHLIQLNPLEVRTLSYLWTAFSSCSLEPETSLKLSDLLVLTSFDKLEKKVVLFTLVPLA